MTGDQAFLELRAEPVDLGRLLSAGLIDCEPMTAIEAPPHSGEE
jgi:hypothetical protein